MALTFENARRTILERISCLSAEPVSLYLAGGRILAEDITAPCDLPLFDNSAMDGFAVRQADCESGKSMPVTGYIPAGGVADGPLPAGSAIRIMTGAPIPPGADAVIPVEETREEGDAMVPTGKVKKHDHIRFQGEDVKAGERIIKRGTLLRPPEINLLASFNLAKVSVFRKARVGILSTGDELVELGQELGPGQIINSNSAALAAAVQQLGAEAVVLGIARDTIESLREKLSEGLKLDILITSAGVSAGDRDLVRVCLDELGVEQIFWKVNIKPGKPTAFGIAGQCAVFSLPGNPVSSMMTFELFVRPALLQMMGRSSVLPRPLRATLVEDQPNKAGRTRFVRVALKERNGRLWASSAGDQNTGIVRTLVAADALVMIPSDCAKLAAGTEVDVFIYGDMSSWQTFGRYGFQVPAVSFVAKSGTGKTTLVEKVIAELKGRGYRVGVIKHDAHRFEIDHPGKDSYRLTAAGAATMLITSPEKLALVKQHPLSPPLDELLPTYFSDVDIVVTEGFKRSALPKIEVHRQERSKTLLCRGEDNDPHLLAVASDEPLSLDVPVLDLNDAAAVCDFVETKFLRPAAN